MKMTLSKALISLLLLSGYQSMASGQGTPRVKPDLQLQYFKDTNEQSYLLATLTYSKDRMVIPVSGIKIIFKTGTGEQSKLADVKTNDQGQVSLNLAGIGNYPGKEDSHWTFSVNSEGNDTLEAGEASISVSDLKLEMDTLLLDSVKTVSLKALKAKNDKYEPAEGILVTVYVPRMFSLLPVGEVTLDATGSGSLEFPSGIPGDKAGNIQVIAKIEDNPDFGNLEKRKIIKWGIAPAVVTHTGHRALWTKTPPTWMIVTLTVLLSGVWGHYLYTIICLFRIKKESRDKKEVKKVEQFIKNA